MAQAGPVELLRHKVVGISGTPTELPEPSAGNIPRPALQGDTGMEKLDLLAQRIDSLIQELNRLREENHSLREEGKKLREEGDRLREDLELGQMTADDLQEKLTAAFNVQAEAATRVDALIGRIQSALPMTEEQQNG